MAELPVLPGVTVFGDDFGVWNWYEFAPEFQRDINIGEPASGGGGGSAPPPPPTEAFAPPLPEVLPEVLVTQPKITPPPPPPLLPTIIETIARIAAPITALIFPQPMGPRALDEAPDPLPVQPEVVVSPPRTPRTPRFDVPLDPIMPPNWNDLVEWAPGNQFHVPRIPFPIYETPRAPSYFPDPLEPELQPFNEPVRIPLPAPQRRPSPRNPGSPRVAPDPFGNPFATPDFIGAPIGDFVFDSAPDFRAKPIGDPRARPLPVPDIVEVPYGPIGDPFIAPERPVIPLPPPNLTPFLTPFGDPTLAPPTLQPYGTPMSPPRDADRCNCKPCTKKKDKKKKKRKDREVCYRGTFKQRAKGTDYKKLEEVPCNSASTSNKGGSSKKRKSRRSPSLGDLAKEIFGPSFNPLGS